MSETEAKDLMKKVMAVMFYRDKKASDMVCFATVTKEGVKMDEPVQVKTEWDLAFYSQQTNEFWRPMRCRQ